MYFHISDILSAYLQRPLSQKDVPTTPDGKTLKRDPAQDNPNTRFACFTYVQDILSYLCDKKDGLSTVELFEVDYTSVQEHLHSHKDLSFLKTISFPEEDNFTGKTDLEEEEYIADWIATIECTYGSWFDISPMSKHKPFPEEEIIARKHGFKGQIINPSSFGDGPK